MVKNFDDINVDFYFNGKLIAHDSKMYADALGDINDVAIEMWEADPEMQEWLHELNINLCGSLAEEIDNIVFRYMVNRLARRRGHGFALCSERPILVVDGGADRQDHWMIDLIS